MYTLRNGRPPVKPNGRTKEGDVDSRAIHRTGFNVVEWGGYYWIVSRPRRCGHRELVSIQGTFDAVPSALKHAAREDMICLDCEREETDRRRELATERERYAEEDLR